MSALLGADSKGQRAGSVRYVLSALLFMNCLLLYAMRLNLSVSITAMVNSSEHDVAPPSDATCRDLTRDAHESHIRVTSSTGEFDWDEREQAMVTYAFFIGYIITQIPGGYLAERHSATWVLGVGMGLTSVLSCLTAVAARAHLYALLALRFVEGLGEGVMYQCVYVFVSKWIPFREQGLLTNLITIGSSVGTIVAMVGSAALCNSSLGWPSSFYVFGILGIVFTILWLTLSTDDPESHRWISPAEREYVVEHRSWTKSKQPKTTPWKKILLSPAVLLLGYQHFCTALNFYMIVTELPSYLKYMFGINIVDNGSISGGMALAGAISAVMCGWAADEILARNLISKNRLRKSATAFRCFVPISCLIIIPQVGCRYEVIVVLMFVNCICQGAGGAGDSMISLDIAPNFPGIVHGVTNCMANIAGVVAPFLVGYFTNHNNTLHQWNIVFICIAFMGSTGMLLFLFFGSTERQSWDEEDNAEDEDRVALLKEA